MNDVQLTVTQDDGRTDLDKYNIKFTFNDSGMSTYLNLTDFFLDWLNEENNLGYIEPYNRWLIEDHISQKIVDAIRRKVEELEDVNLEDFKEGKSVFQMKDFELLKFVKVQHLSKMLNDAKYRYSLYFDDEGDLNAITVKKDPHEYGESG